MHKFLLIVTLLILSGCEYRCIKPESLSNFLHEELDVVSTEQKWVSSGVRISGRAEVTEISIVPSKVNFCSKHYKDFAVQQLGNGPVTITLPFALKKGDSLDFSVVGIKMCKSEDIRYVKIDEKCSNKEEEYFAHILNREECQPVWQNGEYKYTICPNKYIVGDPKKLKWLNGKEYWSLNFSDSSRDEEKIKEIINSTKKQEKNIDCSELSNDQKSKIDTYILNLACGRIYEFYISNKEAESYAYVESNTTEHKLFQSINDSSSGQSVDTKVISNALSNIEVKTNIPHLRIYMDGESFKYSQDGGTYTNYDHEIKEDHLVPKLTLALSDRNGKGGYNIRVTRIPNNSKDDLYIFVSDKFPEHDPDEMQGDIIPVDINRVHNFKYMKTLKEKLKSKSGIIYYGIRDHGCDYKENEGHFNINLTIKEPPRRAFSMIYNFFDEKVKNAFFGSTYKDSNTFHSETSPVKALYQSFIASNKTKTIRFTIVSLLLLHIVLYTLYYFLGLTHVSKYEFLITCVKIGIVIQLLRDNSWDFFYNNAFSFFINTPKQLIEIANFRGTTSNVFEFLDLSLNRFLSAHSVLLIISFIFSGPLGIVSFCLVIWGLIIVVLSVFGALFSFITSIAIVMLLLSLTPIFIICLLFTYTRQMFHNWVKNLAKFAIHPVVLLVFISLISQTIDYILYSVFSFEVCTTCILKVDLKLFKVCILHGYASKHAPNIAAMIAFVILGHTMKALVEASSKISDSLFGVYVQREPEKQYQQSLMGLVGLDEQSLYRRARNGKSAYQTLLAKSREKPQVLQRFQGPKIGP